MKNRKAFIAFIGICVLIGVLCARASYAQNFSVKKGPSIKIEDPRGLPFPLGEHLVYDVYWFGIPVGTGELRVTEKVQRYGLNLYHVIASAKTNDFLTKIYPVSDEIHSYIDEGSGHTLEFRKTLREGRYRADEQITFCPPCGKATYESFLNKTKKEFHFKGGPFDIVSAFYWFRRQPVKVGDKLSLTVNNEEKDWPVELHVLTAEKKKLHSGVVVPTIVVEPKTVYKGVLYDRGRVWVYFSADKKRTPVCIMFKTPFGPVFGVLRDSK